MIPSLSLSHDTFSHDIPSHEPLSLYINIIFIIIVSGIYGDPSCYGHHPSSLCHHHTPFLHTILTHSLIAHPFMNLSHYISSSLSLLYQVFTVTPLAMDTIPLRSVIIEAKVHDARLQLA